MSEPALSSGMTGEEVVAIYRDLDSVGNQWRSWWSDLARFVQPRRYHDLTHSGVAHGMPDKAVHAEVFDSTGVEANLTCARGQLAWMTPRGQKWFGYAAPAGVEATEAVKDYLQRCSKIALDHLLKSNFYKQIFELYLERSGFGTACFSRTFDAENRVFRFRCEGDFVCALGENDEIDLVIVKRCYSHRVAKKIFGDRCPKDVLEKASNPQHWNEVNDYIHAAIPNPNARPDSPLWIHMPYLSIWVHIQTQTVVSEGGANESPYLVTRFLTWSRQNPKGPYGWSPSAAAYPELLQVNVLEKNLDALVDVMVRPRILIPTGMTGRVDMRPGGVTEIEDMSQKPEEWLTNARPDVGFERAEQKRQRVRKAFMVDLFEMFAQLDDRQRTAEEIRARMGEKLDNASPTFDLLGDELLKPLGKWIFATLAEAGEFPPDVPQELLGVDAMGRYLLVPEVEFSSRLALELKAQEDYAAMTSVGEAMAFAEADPTVIDQFDLATIARNRFRSSGAQEGLRKPAEVKRLQLQRQAVQAQMLEAQQAQQG